MKLSTQIDVLHQHYSCEEIIELLARAGYDALDYSFFSTLYERMAQPDAKEYAKHLRHVAEDNGVYFNQAHAPFPSSLPDEAFTEAVYKKIINSMEISSIMGIKNIVVHPKQHLKYADNIQALKEINLEFYNSLIPYCRDFDITVCTENMWQFDSRRNIIHSTCSTPEEFKEYVRMLNSPYIKACLDLGHANIMELDVPRFIRVLGDDLAALHVHDAGNNVDYHITPYSIMGKDYWDNNLKALAEINYSGELTYEANHSIALLPKELIPAAVKYMAEVGHYMTDRFEYFKSNK